jgi:hypothetical protein
MGGSDTEVYHLEMSGFVTKSRIDSSIRQKVLVDVKNDYKDQRRQQSWLHVLYL